MGKTQSKRAKKSQKETQPRDHDSQKDKVSTVPRLQVIGEVNLERLRIVREKAQNEPYTLEVVAVAPNRHAL